MSDFRLYVTSLLFVVSTKLSGDIQVRLFFWAQGSITAFNALFLFGCCSYDLNAGLGPTPSYKTDKLLCGLFGALMWAKL